MNDKLITNQSFDLDKNYDKKADEMHNFSLFTDFTGQVLKYANSFSISNQDNLSDSEGPYRYKKIKQSNVPLPKPSSQLLTSYPAFQTFNGNKDEPRRRRSKILQIKGGDESHNRPLMKFKKTTKKKQTPVRRSSINPEPKEFEDLLIEKSIKEDLDASIIQEDTIITSLDKIEEESNGYRSTRSGLTYGIINQIEDECNEDSRQKKNNNSQKALHLNKLKQFKSKYKDLFIERKQGFVVTEIDSKWICNTFARLRCDPAFLKETDTRIMEKTAEYCSVGIKTLRRLISDDKGFIDKRLLPKKDNNPLLPDTLKEKIQHEIETCLKRGFPCNSRYLQDFLKEEGINVSRGVIMRRLKKWGIKYGELKIEDNRKEREYVLANLKIYLERISKNNQLPEICTLSHQQCTCELKKKLVYLDESYIHQNHVTRFGYYLPHAENIKKPLGKGPRIVMVAAICYNGWLGVEHEKIKSFLEKFDETGTHQYGSIKYWISNSRKKDYHRDFNQEIFLDYFQNTLLPNLDSPSIIILDNAPYHKVYDKNILIPSKATKQELKNWLQDRQIPFDDKAAKVDLIEIAEMHAPLPENLINVLAEKKGKQKFGIPHDVLYLPQYHPELNPIEYAWAQVKSMAAYGPTYNLECLRKEVMPNCFSVINATRAKKLFNHVYKVEQNLSKNYDWFKNLNEIALKATPKEFDPSDEELGESEEEEEDDGEDEIDPELKLKFQLK